MRRGVAEPANADDERMRRAKFVLRVRTELRQQNMAAVAKKLRVIHSRIAKRQRPARWPGVLSNKLRSGFCRHGLRLRSLRLQRLSRRNHRRALELIQRLLQLKVLIGPEVDSRWRRRSLHAVGRRRQRGLDRACDRWI